MKTIHTQLFNTSESNQFIDEINLTANTLNSSEITESQSTWQMEIIPSVTNKEVLSSDINNQSADVPASQDGSSSKFRNCRRFQAVKKYQAGVAVIFQHKITLARYYDLLSTSYQRTNQGLYVCVNDFCNCGQKTGNSEALFRHFSHNGVFKFVCKRCDTTFTLWESYRRHDQVVHKDIKRYVCNWPGCGKRFAAKMHWTVHTNSHAGIKNVYKRSKRGKAKTQELQTAQEEPRPPLASSHSEGNFYSGWTPFTY